jgi:hypothetical protein
MSDSKQISTHWDDCWRDPRHHKCAVARVERQQAQIEALKLLVAERNAQIGLLQQQLNIVRLLQQQQTRL